MKNYLTDPVQTSVEGMLLSSMEFVNALNYKVVPLEAINIEADLFLYWRKEGLLPFFPKGAWAKCSFAQVIWVEMLKDLRVFGYAMKKMHRLTDYLFKRAYDDDLPQRNLEWNRDQLKKKELAGTLEPKEKEVLAYLEEVLQDDVQLYVLKYNINYLTNLITLCFNSGEEAGLLLFIDGTIAEFREGAYYSIDNDVDPSKPHIYLSMRHYCKGFVNKQSLLQIVSPLQGYIQEEQKVLRAIRHPNTREVRVDVRDGKVQRVESTSGGTITGEQAQKIKEVLGLKNYEKMTLDTMDDKNLSFKKTKKKL